MRTQSNESETKPLTYLSIIPPDTTYQRGRHFLQLRVLPTVVMLFVVVFFIVAFYIRFTAVRTHGPVAAATSASPLLFRNIRATFFKNSSNFNGTFNITSLNDFIFKQSFPVIAFNPDPSTQKCRKSTGVNIQTRPFTDVVQNPDGTCDTIRVQDNRGHRAGVGNLYAFEAVFLGYFTAPGKGMLTLQIRADDGWILSIGANSNGGNLLPQPTNIPAYSSVGSKSPIYNLPEMGGNDRSSSPTLFKLTVHIPAAGTYPVEIDYTECCGGSLTLVVSNAFAPLLS